jgi:nicotinate-nucleotide adenylyltransferase
VRLAIFGGVFDPIHCAHLAIAHAATEQFHLDKVLFVPSGAPPHKSGATYASYHDRLMMTELACANDLRFEASRLEEDTSPSYSVDTVEKVKATLGPADELFFIIGADAFAEISTWRRWRDLAQSVTFIVVSRPGSSYSVPPEVHVERLDSVDLPVSSSNIREVLARGEAPAEIPSRVFEYIQSHGLYSMKQLR